MITLPKILKHKTAVTTRRIRVSFVIDNLSRAGTETQLLALIRTLDRSRFEPTLVLLDGESAASQSLEPPDCTVIRLGVTKLLGVNAFRKSAALYRFWRKHRPDIAQFYFLDSAYYGIPIAKLAGIPHILRVRNNLGYWQTSKHRILGRMVKPFVKATLTNSDAGRDALTRQERLSPARIHVIENGVDVERFTPAPGLRSRIACVANLRPVKNIDGLIRAMAVAVKQVPHATLHIAGDGEQRQELETLSESLGLKDAVTFAGSVSDIPQFLRQAEVVVLPSHSEGMSNALLEAMAAGKAIVATDVGANAKVLAGTGTIVPARDDNALAQSIITVLKDPFKIQSMGQSARHRVQADYSREAMKKRFEEFYETVLIGFARGSANPKAL